MNIKAILSDANYKYVAIGITIAITAIAALRYIVGSNNTQFAIVSSSVVLFTILAAQAVRMYLYSKQLSTSVKNK